ncbi:hypothetical protein [Bradyrhizobium liaoningense]|uniref:hypothetical protein n=1 Tax=Bradyrhizobium liaoningense TaxID=43992 RepID=UPI001BA7F0D1|nr:hypothetical protein [Bradyrhizobium liaoningense]MBR0906151.1 hypothetical protein [Bradyrhizobium liaoningense]
MIADAIFCAIAGLDYYHAIACALIPRGLEAGLVLYGWTRRLIDATARARLIDQEDLKVGGELCRNDILLKCAITPT